MAAAEPPGTAKAPRQQRSLLIRSHPQPSTLLSMVMWTLANLRHHFCIEQEPGSEHEAEAAKGNDTRQETPDAPAQKPPQQAHRKEQPAAGGKEEPVASLEAAAEGEADTVFAAGNAHAEQASQPAESTEQAAAGSSKEPQAAQQEVGQGQPSKKPAARGPDLPDLVPQGSSAATQPELETFTAELDALDRAVDDAAQHPAGAGKHGSTQQEKAGPAGAGGQSAETKQATPEPEGQGSAQGATATDMGHGCSRTEHSAAAAAEEQALPDLSSAEVHAVEQAVKQAEEPEQQQQQQQGSSKKEKGSTGAEGDASHEASRNEASKDDVEQSDDQVKGLPHAAQEESSGKEEQCGAISKSVGKDDDAQTASAQPAKEESKSTSDPAQREQHDQQKPGSTPEPVPHEQPVLGNKAVPTEEDAKATEVQERHEHAGKKDMQHSGDAAKDAAEPTEPASKEGVSAYDKPDASAAIDECSAAGQPATDNAHLPKHSVPAAPESEPVGAPHPNGHAHKEPEDAVVDAPAHPEDREGGAPAQDSDAAGVAHAYDPLGLEGGEDEEAGTLEQACTKSPACWACKPSVKAILQPCACSVGGSSLSWVTQGCRCLVGLQGLAEKPLSEAADAAGADAAEMEASSLQERDVELNLAVALRMIADRGCGRMRILPQTFACGMKICCT